jgi:nucleoside 2-deoxyribosyltransferase
MAARGKFCLGYSNDPAIYADRVRRSTEVTAQAGHLVDADGLTVEDFGHTDNLMMIHALDLYGAPLVLPRAKPVDIWHDLTAFEVCVAMAAARLVSA